MLAENVLKLNSTFHLSSLLIKSQLLYIVPICVSIEWHALIIFFQGRTRNNGPSIKPLGTPYNLKSKNFVHISMSHNCHT